MAVTLLLGLAIEPFDLVNPSTTRITSFPIICGGKIIELTSILTFLQETRMKGNICVDVSNAKTDGKCFAVEPSHEKQLTTENTGEF